MQSILPQRKIITRLLIIFLIFVILVGSNLFDVNTNLRAPKSVAAQETTSTPIFIPMIRVNDPWTNPVGIETHLSLATATSETDKLAGLEPSWVRLNAISWRDLQSDPGTPFEWNKLVDFENNLEILASLRVRPIVVIDDYPSWATVTGNNCGPLAPNYYDDFALFVSAVVSRYKIEVQDWELGNEVDVDPTLVDPDSVYGCWGMISDLQYYGGYQYGEMLKIVGPAIKAANPNANVWHGGLLLGKPDSPDPSLGNPENFIRGVLASGAAPYFDILPYHAHGLYYGSIKDTYNGPLNPWLSWGGGVRGKARFLRAIMQEYGVDKPMMVNEIGIGCLPTEAYCNPLPAEFYEFKADMAIRVAARILNENLMGLIWYTLEGPGWRSAGLLNADKTPQLAYTALQVFSEQTKGAPIVGQVDYGDPGIEAYSFKLSGNHELHVVFAFENTPISISIPKSSFIGAVDREGLPVPKVDMGTAYELSVGFSPIFIERTP